MLRRMFLVFGFLFTGMLVWADANADAQMVFMKIFAQAAERIQKSSDQSFDAFKIILSQEFQNSIKSGEITKEALSSVVKQACNGRYANMEATIKDALALAIKQLDGEKAENAPKDEASKAAQQAGGIAGGGEAGGEKTAEAPKDEPSKVAQQAGGEAGGEKTEEAPKDEPSQVAQQAGGTAGGGEAGVAEKKVQNELTIPVDGEKLYNALFTAQKKNADGEAMLINALSKIHLEKAVRAIIVNSKGESGAAVQPDIEMKDDKVILTVRAKLEVDQEKYKKEIQPLKEVLKQVSTNGGKRDTFDSILRGWGWGSMYSDMLRDDKKNQGRTQIWISDNLKCKDEKSSLLNEGDFYELRISEKVARAFWDFFLKISLNVHFRFKDELGKEVFHENIKSSEQLVVCKIEADASEVQKIKSFEVSIESFGSMW